MEKTEEGSNIQIYDQIQKITEALYRVTELFSDKEPLKWQLRDIGIRLFDLLASNEGKETSNPEKVRDLAKKLGRFLQLAYNTSAFVSAINFEVLRREYLALEEKFPETAKMPVLKELKIPQTEDTYSNGHNGQTNVSNGHNGQPHLLKERQKKILSTFKGNEWVAIRDISASLPEFGGKSIQRDLMEMADAGILKKTGDKRWRKYSLV